MRSISIKEYARVHKMSIYTVVKLSKNGTLKTEIKKVNGKDEVFILEDQELKSIDKDEKIEDYQKAYFKLKQQYIQLQAKYEKLLKKSM